MTQRAAFALFLLLSACGDETREGVTIRVGQVDVRVQVARTHEERRRGLQGVTSLAPDEGMLFLYRRPGTRRIWMKGCKIDLDVAFLDEQGRVVQVTTLRAPASDEEAPQAVSSKRPSALVLETNAGWFERNGLGTGTHVVLPPSLDLRDADP